MHEFLDVYLDFSLFQLLFGGFYAFWMFIWMLDIFILLFYFKNLYGLCKNHMHYGMMNLLGII